MNCELEFLLILDSRNRWNIHVLVSPTLKKLFKQPSAFETYRITQSDLFVPGLVDKYKAIPKSIRMTIALEVS